MLSTASPATPARGRERDDAPYPRLRVARVQAESPRLSVEPGPCQLRRLTLPHPGDEAPLGEVAQIGLQLGRDRQELGLLEEALPRVQLGQLRGERRPA